MLLLSLEPIIWLHSSALCGGSDDSHGVIVVNSVVDVVPQVLRRWTNFHPQLFPSKLNQPGVVSAANHLPSTPYFAKFPSSVIGPWLRRGKG